MKELEVTAELAHVGFSRADLEAASPSFAQMLMFFEAMAAADTDEAAWGGPLSALTLRRPLADAAHFRSDGAAGNGAAAGLVGNAGEHDGQFIVIPNVL